jgi:molecular chaperone GrpE (heat shock protein)
VLIEIGVFTAEELAAQKQAEEIEAAKKRLEAERRQYERLRAQFESGV